jgi:hypothetical protein
MAVRSRHSPPVQSLNTRCCEDRLNLGLTQRNPQPITTSRHPLNAYHATAILRQQGGGQARLVINQVPCPNCDRNLPRALPEGAELELLGPGGFRMTYRGLPD